SLSQSSRLCLRLSLFLLSLVSSLFSSFFSSLLLWTTGGVTQDENTYLAELADVFKGLNRDRPLFFKALKRFCRVFRESGWSCLFTVLTNQALSFLELFLCSCLFTVLT